MTLQQISSAYSSTTNTWPDPSTTNPPHSPPYEIHKKTRKRRQRSPHEPEMGVAGSPSRHSKTALRTAKDNRRITCTLQPESASANQSAFAPATVQEKRTRLRRRKFLGPETRPGTHQQLPISIDSDDENNSAASSNTQRQPISIESDGETDSVVSPTTQPPPIAIESDDELDSVVALETSASAAVRYEIILVEAAGSNY